MIYTFIHGRDPIPCRTTYIEYRSPVNIFINFLRITIQFHWFSLQNSFLLQFYDTSRLQSRNPAKPEEKKIPDQNGQPEIFYVQVFCFSIPEDAFILCIGFFNRFRKMLLEAEIIDSVFYVCHLRYIYIYGNINIYIYIFIYGNKYIYIYIW